MAKPNHERDIRDQVDSLRVKIQATKDKLAKAHNVRPSFEVVKGQLLERLDGLAGNGKAEATLGLHEGKFLWINNNQTAEHRVNRLEGIIAWLLRDVLREKLVEKLENFYEEEDLVVDTPDFRASMAKARKELFQMEVEEERLIQALATRGLQYHRRPDVDPRALIEA